MSGTSAGAAITGGSSVGGGRGAGAGGGGGVALATISAI